jgi:hypothetical protein
VIRAVIDTNALVSAAIKPRGEAGRILDHLRHDLLTLSPFEGIPIIKPTLFLQQLDGDL